MGIFTNHKVAAQNKVRQEAARLSLARSGWVRRRCPIRGAFEAYENSSVDTCGATHVPRPFFGSVRSCNPSFDRRLMHHGPNASGCDGIMTCIWEVFGSLKSQPSGTGAHRRVKPTAGLPIGAAQIKLITPAHTHTLPLSPSILGKCACRATIMEEHAVAQILNLEQS